MEFEGVPSDRKLTISVDTGQQKRIPWLIVLVALAAAVFVVAKVCNFVASKRSVFLERRRCESMEGRGKIYLLLYNQGNSQATAQTILSAYRQAFCKQNIVVGVYQEVSSERDVYGFLQHGARSKNTMEWVDRNVGIVSVDHSGSGYVWAIQELFRRSIFADAEWCFLTRPGNTFLAEWDKVLLDEYRRLRRTAPLENTPVLTHFSRPAERPLREKAPERDRHMFSEWMDNMIGEGQQHLNKNVKDIISYFPTVQTFKGYIPIIYMQRFSQTPRQAVQVVAATTQSMFLPQSFLERTLFELELFEHPVAAYAVDIALSAALWMENGTFFALSSPVVHRFAKEKSVRPDGWNGKGFADILIQDYHPYFDFVGIDLAKRKIAGRAMMGLFPSLEKEEILEKYGSMMEYDRMLRTLKITL